MIPATTRSFLQNYSTVWNEEGYLEISDTEFEFPYDLDPSHLGIEYTHGQMPDELECFVSGKFFVDNIAFLKSFAQRSNIRPSNICKMCMLFSHITA